MEILGRLIHRLNQPKAIPNPGERISLFAISSLPPLFIEVIHALAQHTDITLYQHSPTDQYWADLKTRKSLSRLRLQKPEQASYFETGNELLASWGRQGQILQDLLLEQGALPVSEIDVSQPPGNACLLQSIQQSIFDLKAETMIAKADNSLSVHICHSALRECQVLHDYLLTLLGENPLLSNEDILVMVPEISHYAPYIEAVFAHDEKQARPYLSWNLSDISIADEHPLIRTFLQLLKLPNSRFEYSEILSLLEIAEIRQRFNLDEQALNDIHGLLEESRVRWGIDAEFKVAMDLPPTLENTWQQARQRIFAGYALGEVNFWNGIAPLAQAEGNRATSAGKFYRLFDRLQYWRSQLGKPTNAEQWMLRLNQLLDDFFQLVDLREDHLQPIRDTLDDLNFGEDTQVSPDLLRYWLEKQLGSKDKQGRLFSGGITFCGMQPMRNLPFPVICLLGMNDSAFPRRPVTTDFDLMASHWQPGDPHASDQDRYLMLETLLCARQNLYISYTGRSLKDNSECQPSVLVQELLDFIDDQFDTDSKAQLSEQLTTVHPMQPFSAQNYLLPQMGYDRYWCEVAQKMNQPTAKQVEKSWPQLLALSADESTGDIDLAQLQRFLRHPIKYFFNTRFRIFLTEENQNENDECFSLDALSAWEIKTRLADNVINTENNQLEILRAEGKLPHGQAAEIELENIYTQHRQWLEQLVDYSDVENQPRSIQLQLDNTEFLNGEVRDYYPGKGLMHYTASKLKGAHLLAIWLDHLALCASKQFGENETSVLITTDKTIKFEKVDSVNATRQLTEYTQLYREGQQSILPIFPNCSYAFARQADNNRALADALKAWHQKTTFGNSGDSLDSYIALSMRGNESPPLNEPVFADYASRVFAGLLTELVDA